MNFNLSFPRRRESTRLKRWIPAFAGMTSSGFNKIPIPYYIARRQKGRDIARKAVRLCLDVFSICAVDDQILERAYTLAGIDFEDDLQIASAQSYSLNAIVTRDKDDFEHSPILALTPDELLKQINHKKDK
ncbi:MAG: PIN domain-containing protein [Chloroflexi bacterium]|nr:PIN domain-containing protein [Chloroflexota bacterium]